MVGFSLLLAAVLMEVVRAQVDEMGSLPQGAVPITPELKCVSGFCLPRGYKKLETPITEGKYRQGLSKLPKSGGRGKSTFYLNLAKKWGTPGLHP